MAPSRGKHARDELLSSSEWDGARDKPPQPCTLRLPGPSQGEQSGTSETSSPLEQLVSYFWRTRIEQVRDKPVLHVGGATRKRLPAFLPPSDPPCRHSLGSCHSRRSPQNMPTLE